MHVHIRRHLPSPRPRAETPSTMLRWASPLTSEAESRCGSAQHTSYSQGDWTDAAQQAYQQNNSAYQGWEPPAQNYPCSCAGDTAQEFPPQIYNNVYYPYQGDIAPVYQETQNVYPEYQQPPGDYQQQWINGAEPLPKVERATQSQNPYYSETPSEVMQREICPQCGKQVLNPYQGIPNIIPQMQGANENISRPSSGDSFGVAPNEPQGTYSGDSFGVAPNEPQVTFPGNSFGVAPNEPQVTFPGDIFEVAPNEPQGTGSGEEQTNPIVVPCYPVRPIRWSAPCHRCNCYFSCPNPRMSQVTVYSASYQPVTAGGCRPLPVRPRDNLHLAGALPLPQGCAPAFCPSPAPPHPFAPIDHQGLVTPVGAFPMSSLTVNRASYQPVMGVGARAALPWVPAKTYQCPWPPLQSTTVYDASYMPPGCSPPCRFIPCRTATGSVPPCYAS